MNHACDNSNMAKSLQMLFEVVTNGIHKFFFAVPTGYTKFFLRYRQDTQNFSCGTDTIHISFFADTPDTQNGILRIHTS